MKAKTTLCALLLCLAALPAHADNRWDTHDRWDKRWDTHDRWDKRWDTHDRRNKRWDTHNRRGKRWDTHNRRDKRWDTHSRWDIHIHLGGQGNSRHWRRHAPSRQRVLILPGARAWNPGRGGVTRCYERRLDRHGREIRVYLEPWRCR